MKKHIITSLALAALLTPSLALATPLFNAVDLGILSDQVTNQGVYARDINESGQVVGHAAASDRDLETGAITTDHNAFLWENGVMTSLGTTVTTSEETTKTFNSSAAFAINDNGTIVGSTSDHDSGTPDIISQEAFVYDSTSGMQSIHHADSDYSRATSVNNDGKVVGYYDANDGNNANAFSYDETSGFTPLGTPSGESWSDANDISDDGTIVGVYGTGTISGGNYHAFLYDTTLSDLTSAEGSSAANAINNNGDKAVGVGVVPDEEEGAGEIHAYIYNTGSDTAEDLGTLDKQDQNNNDHNYSYAHDVNDSGQVVGHSGYTWFDDGTYTWLEDSTAFYYDGEEMYNLNDLISSLSIASLGEFYLTDALGINNSTQIIAWGYYENDPETNRSFLLTPIPEPSTMLLFGAGVAGIAGIARRKK